MKKYIFTSLILIVLLVGTYYAYSTNTDLEDTSTNEQIINAITKDTPALSNEGSPVFEIKSTKKFNEKWYVVDISSLRETAIHISVYVVLVENNDSLQVILGPDTHFTETEMLQYNVPDSIIKEFNK